MFVNAIKKISDYTRPIHSITRTYNGVIQPGTSTLFFVNENGVAITCRHVIGLLAQAEKTNSDYANFKAERDMLDRHDGRYKKKLRDLEIKYQLQKETVVQIKHRFIGVIESFKTIRWQVHPTLDLAILHFEGFNKLLYSSYATFVKDPEKIKQGRYLCRFGYPFPEFDNFHHNSNTDDIEWTTGGKDASPAFPIDGIITRFLGDEKQIQGIELSTPGLKGQSGGPLFDTDGLVYGMQYATNHLHLGFDIKDHKIIKDGKETKVSNSPFLHVGQCVHADRIKEFLQENKIKFYEETR